MFFQEDSVEKARELLRRETPLAVDCGLYCGAACCQSDGESGAFLFPGEDKRYADCAWARVKAGVLYCDGHCPRDERPLGCRIFPLSPVYKDGRWRAKFDGRARVMCPMARGGIKGLRPDFVRAVEQAFRLIAETPAGEAFLRDFAAREAAFAADRHL